MSLDAWLDKSILKISQQLDVEFNFTLAHHNFELGLPRENALKVFFQRYFPTRYGFSSGYLVDFEGTQSNQCDWIIYDQVYFQPIMAKSFTEDTLEVLYYDSAFGGVEVKSRLTEEVLIKAIKQVASLKKLKRSNYETAACFTPLIDAKLLITKNVSSLKTANFYSGIYAYSSAHTTGLEIIDKLFEVAAAEGILYEDLPDFVSVHGKFYVCKSEKNILPDDSIRDRLTNLPQQENSFTWLDCKEKTAGIFYFRMLERFNNTFLHLNSVNHSISKKVNDFALCDVKIFTGKTPLPVKS
jgi:hypothetical protein